MNPSKVMAKLATLGLSNEQAEAVAGMLMEVESATQAEAERTLEQRRAADRKRQAKRRGAARDAEQPIVVNGKWNEGEWQRRRQIVFERDNWTCVYCGEDVHVGAQCDHVVPVSRGGGSEIDNLATACKRCNSGKSGKHLSDWEGPSWGPSQQH